MIAAGIPTSPLAIADPSLHSMGDSLKRYVQSRVHELVDGAEYERVLVVGSYDRSLVVSEKEKVDKRENWQRPTAELTREGTLRIHCFPGRSYVFHYGSVIATHLALTRRDPSVVEILLPEPSLSWREIDRAGYTRLDPTETLIIASGNDRLAPPDAIWIDHGSFFTRTVSRGSTSQTWLAVKHSFWGDVAFHLGNAVATAGFRRVVFVGKLGSLVPDHIPNVTLATGSSSQLGTETVTWLNAFADVTEPHYAFGRHVTVPSVIQETIEWKNVAMGRVEFVDPEIGNMASGVLSGGAQFSYLHIVSDNLARKYEQDLSNERESAVTLKREEAYVRIGQILEQF